MSCFQSARTRAMHMEHLKGLAITVGVVVMALAVIHYVAPDAVKKHLGVS